MAEALSFEEIPFAAPQLRFSVFRLIDVRKQCVPAQNLPVGQSHRQRTYLEPSVDAICAQKALLNIMRIAGLDRARPCGDDQRAIVRMDDERPIFQLLE